MGWRLAPLGGCAVVATDEIEVEVETEENELDRERERELERELERETGVLRDEEAGLLCVSLA